MLGIFAVIIELASYSIYFIGIYQGKTKPHAFSWFVWGVLTLVGFAAVLTTDGGSVSWILGINALVNFIIAGIGFWQKNVQYDAYDWAALLGSFLGVFFWWLTSNPLYAVILVSISDAVAVVPTFRKAYRLPFEENSTSFVVGILYYILAILALTSFNFTTILYPIAIIVVDASLITMIYIRRSKTHVS